MLDLSECQDLLGSRLPHLRVLPASGGDREEPRDGAGEAFTASLPVRPSPASLTHCQFLVVPAALLSLQGRFAGGQGDILVGVSKRGTLERGLS